MVDQGRTVQDMSRVMEEALRSDDVIDKLNTLAVEYFREAEPELLAQLDEGEEDDFVARRNALTKAAAYWLYLNW